MKKENDISFIDFLDFEIFAVPSDNLADIDTKNTAQKEIFVSYFNEKNDSQIEELLKNILTAAKLNFDKDIALLKTTPQQKFSLKGISEKVTFKDFLLFGIELSNFGINYSLTPYQPITVNNIRYLKVDSLEEINSDVNKKKALWSCLKEMYL